MLAGAPPSSLDYVSVYVDEAAIGAKPTSLAALREHLSKLPFEPSMNGIGAVCGQGVRAATTGNPAQRRGIDHLGLALDWWSWSALPTRRLFTYAGTGASTWPEHVMRSSPQMSESV